ncbi:DUF305 domain-containing protein [Allocoleopsis sp.]|uniref:DUF305 domain-containing protein n=1 Tax=Allocoleopsis sp. TaxID=3088169 RepID=UPI0032C22FE7
MQPISVKTSFLAFTFFAIASATSGVLTGCSTAAQNQAQTENTSTKQAGDKQDTMHGGSMNHGSGMDHSMSMDLGPADADYELRFLDAMIPHHQGAVEMAQEVLAKSQRPEMKKLAQDIIAAQKREINQMKQWRKAWYPKADSKPMAWHAQMGHMMAMSPEQMQAMMMKGDLGAADAEFDLRFLNAMIPHHEGALVMAKDVLSKSKRPELKKLAQEILSSQQEEIDQMKQWRKAWYKQ